MSRDLFSLEPPENDDGAIFPKCACCGIPIQSDFLYDIDGELFCERCMESEFKQMTDSYIEWR